MRTSFQNPVAATLFALVLALHPHPTSASDLNLAPSSLLSIDQNRATVVDRIVAQWGDSLAASGAGLDKEQLRAMMMGLRSDHLLAASLAGSLDGLRNVIANALTANAPVAKGLIQTKALGDTTDDLVYTPVTPCGIVDSRNGGGPFAPGGETRNYHAYLTSGTFATQGGAPSNCAIPANPAAVALNITALGGGSFLTAWPYNTTQPLASTLNPAPGQTVANGALVRTCAPSCAFEFSIFTFGAQVIIDVVGYFAAPGAPITSGGFKGTWNAATTYGMADMVLQASQFYWSLVPNNLGADPAYVVVCADWTTSYAVLSWWPNKPPNGCYWGGGVNSGIPIGDSYGSPISVVATSGSSTANTITISRALTLKGVGLTYTQFNILPTYLKRITVRVNDTDTSLTCDAPPGSIVTPVTQCQGLGQLALNPGAKINLHLYNPGPETASYHLTWSIGYSIP